MDIRMDRGWLEGLGYSGLDDDTVASLLATARETLELRVGDVLSAGLLEWQTDEFIALVDGDVETARAWALHYSLDPSLDPLHRHLTDEAGARETPETILCEWARVTWLRRNAPDYQIVVRRCVEDLETELRNALAGILLEVV